MKEEGLSFKDRLNHSMEEISVAVTMGKPAKEFEKSYADKDYSGAEMDENGQVSHDYDSNCPYCHNLSQSDMIAHSKRMRTEQSMKEFKD